MRTRIIAAMELVLISPAALFTIALTLRLISSRCNTKPLTALNS